MSELNGFSVSIPETRNEDCMGNVKIDHKQQFRIRLHNSHKFNGCGKPADADVYVDGKHVGTFRVSYGQTVMLEHPINDNGKFTAYRKGSSEAYQAGINAYSDDAGLIKVVFKPGTKTCPVVTINAWTQPITYSPNWYCNLDNVTYRGGYSTNTQSMSYNNDCATTKCCVSSENKTRGAVSGGVGLSGMSNQSFHETDKLLYDEQSHTVYLRLIFDAEDMPRSIYDHRPVYSTNYPRPLR